MEWFRLYNEFSTDPKLLSFSKADRYDLVCLLCLASSSQERGTLLLDDEDLAACLSVSVEEFEHFTSRLIKKTILERTRDGWLRFVHWEARQPHSDSAAGRMREYRARQKMNTETNSSEQCSTPLRNGDVTVTDRTEQNRTEKIERETHARPTREAVQEYAISYGRPEEAEGYFNDRTSIGFHKRGQAIVDWQADFRSWCGKSHQYSKDLNGEPSLPPPKRQVIVAPPEYVRDYQG